MCHIIHKNNKFLELNKIIYLCARMPAETAFKMNMIRKQAYRTYSLPDVCWQIVQNILGLSIEFIPSTLLLFRKWFHLDSNDAAVLLTFLIAEKKQNWNHPQPCNYIHYLPISSKWKYLLTIVSIRVFYQGILLIDNRFFYSSKIYEFRINMNS